MLVDGVIVGSVPASALVNMDVDMVIGVYLKAAGPRHPPTNIFQIVGEAFQIAQSENQATWRRFCDLVIEPNVEDFRWDDFDRAEELMAVGESAALKALPALRRLLQPPVTVPVAVGGPVHSPPGTLPSKRRALQPGRVIEAGSDKLTLDAGEGK